MFALESFVLAWFLRISKHNVWVSQSILLQLLAMRTQNPNLSCASAFVRQSRTFHSINVLCTFYRMHTFLNPEYHSGLIWIQTVFANVEREREMQARQSKPCTGGSTSREREREREREKERERCVCVCVFFLNFVSFVFFTLGTRLRISKFCVDLCKKKKSDRTRCLAVSILEYNLGPEINGSKVDLQY